MGLRLSPAALTISHSISTPNLKAAHHQEPLSLFGLGSFAGLEEVFENLGAGLSKNASQYFRNGINSFGRI